MGLFDLLKKKEKAYICARCKKEMRAEESEWIGNHRFCSKCAAPPQNITVAPGQAKARSVTAKPEESRAVSYDRQKEAEKIRSELLKKEERKLRQRYPNEDAWRAPRNIADSMGCVGCAQSMLVNFERELNRMTDEAVIEKYKRK